MSTSAKELPAPVVSVPTLEDCIDHVLMLCDTKDYVKAQDFMYRIFTELNPQFMVVLYTNRKPSHQMSLQHYVIQQLNQQGVYECLLNTLNK